MKKLSVTQAVKKVVKNREKIEALVQKLTDKKASPRVEVSAMESKVKPEKNVSDNLALLSKVLEIHGAITTGSGVRLATELDNKIYEALKKEVK